MSASPEERDDAAGEEDASEEEMTGMVDMPAGQSYASDDEPFQDQGDNEEGGDITTLLQEERRQSSEQPAEGTGVINRYKELAHEDSDAAVSDNGSAEALELPRRAGSPVGSMLSVPDDTPSVQVCLSFDARIPREVFLT